MRTVNLDNELRQASCDMPHLRSIHEFHRRTKLLDLFAAALEQCIEHEGAPLNHRAIELGKIVVCIPSNLLTLCYAHSRQLCCANCRVRTSFTIYSLCISVH